MFHLLLYSSWFKACSVVQNNSCPFEFLNLLVQQFSCPFLEHFRWEQSPPSFAHVLTCHEGIIIFQVEEYFLKDVRDILAEDYFKIHICQPLCSHPWFVRVFLVRLCDARFAVDLIAARNTTIWQFEESGTMAKDISLANNFMAWVHIALGF